MTSDSDIASGIGRDPSAPALSAQQFQDLVEMIGTDMPEVLVDLLDTYLQESAGLVQGIVDAQRASDVNGMLRPAHSLKSSSASIGAMHLSRLCAAIEAHARGGSPGLDVAAVVQAVEFEFARVQAELAVERDKFASQ